jgi:predicted DNA-binding protein (MmcQ/YjbR family)
MTRDGLRTFCLSLPHATEDIKWEHHLCFLIAKKMFAVANVEYTDGHFVAVKSTRERASELIETDGIIPTPYMARNNWVTLQREDVLRDEEIKQLIRESYALILAKLPKRIQAELAGATKRPLKKSSATKAKKAKRSRTR